MKYELFNDSDYDNALKLKKKLLTAYFITLGVAVVIVAMLVLLHSLLPYTHDVKINRLAKAYEWSGYVFVVLYCIFSVIYLGIPYKKARYYFEYMDDIKRGKKSYGEVTFLNFDERISEVRYVEFKTMVVLEYSEKTTEYERRNVLIDKEKPLPDFKHGDILNIETHANTLLSYTYKL